MDEDNPLINVSMQIILHAGNARNDAAAALEAAKNGKYEESDKLMVEAQDNIRLAHQAQTNILQDEMNGKHYNLCILFIHAQDTLMTIKSEISLTEQMISMQKEINALKENCVR